ncbi:putative m-phase inducer phosphatase(cdc25) [Schistosoma mansoni]|uniref:putative m-phase inducer phosphatase(cdc25) n=1 Tax=Schistosoma mansoni TaxID=6183 RepID=UPI0001A62F29|nr:putative m-phase inducer phosphatase(cdc25) [Schistosoma mansoni]|eukprot:XP_018647564.1 putative m-phase inducer phosphatase(cdc25) [Schistosoma mansoni]
MDSFEEESFSTWSLTENKYCLEEMSNSVENIQRTFSETALLSLQNQLDRSLEKGEYNLNLSSYITASDDKENYESPRSRQMLIPNEIVHNHISLPGSQYESDLCFPSICTSSQFPSSVSPSSSSSSECIETNEEQLKSKCTNRSECRLPNLRFKHQIINLSKLEMIHQHLVIIDCRYPYEYDAGHIYSAINLSDWPNLCKYFFGAKQSIRTFEADLSKSSSSSTDLLVKPKPSPTLFVLHCEFSTKRAPQLFHLLRNYDRTLHFTSYPALKYPFVYILRGGYSAFFKNYPHLCEPSNYLQMHSRPDLLGIWRKHCSMVNRQLINDNPQLIYAKMVGIRFISAMHISSRDLQRYFD